MTADPWIVAPANRVPSVNRYGADNRPGYVLPVECLILHYTAGYSHTGSARWLASAAAKASAHFVVGRGGELLQLVRLDERAWHAGGSSSRWRGKPVNARSLGIEVANLGWLKDTASGGLVDVWGRPFTGEAVRDPSARAWEVFPAAQVETVCWLVAELVRRFPVLGLEDAPSTGQERITGHQYVDPARKADPGPAFPWYRVREAARAAATVRP